MTEEFLHHIWKFKLFDQLELKTTQGESVEIQRAGDHNFDSGPDFFNAHIKIGGLWWVGNVEVHIYSSDWKRHQHQKDKAYDNIILHVVHQADEKLYRSSGEEIPTLEIKERVNRKLYQNYLDFKSSSEWIPCVRQVGKVPSYVLQNTIDKMLLERLERKSISILNSLKLNTNNWEETFYQHLARNFGFKTNSAPFELLAKTLPARVIKKQRTSLLQVEALLFGQAGMLFEHFQDKYPMDLQNEYTFLKQKYNLEPIEKHLWKYLRLRPVNFPDVRIAQLAGLLFHTDHLFSKILEAENVSDLKKLFEFPVSEYWKKHYMLDRWSPKRGKELGGDGIENIIINSVVPFLFVYGKQKDEEKYFVKAIRFLEETNGEENVVIRKWSAAGVPVGSAFNTQALLQLKNEYCHSKKCLMCPIGNYLLKNS